MPNELSSEMLRFIQEHIKTVASLDILLLLHRSPGREWTPEEVANELRTSVFSVKSFLDLFVAKGLILQKGERFGYNASSPLDEGKVNMLAREYTMRPVSVVNAIYAVPEPEEKPEDKIQSFADAFRIKKG